jgi:acetylornithine deacetylase/succinyl-diaminopimelate desuccinylase-like protein
MIRRTFVSLTVALALLSGPPAVAASEDYAALAVDEATHKLQTLLRIDTTNPPGNEAEAAKVIARWLKAEGLTPELYESASGRSTVMARLKGSGKRPPLLLLNHLDVVTAEPERWKHPPFSGALVDGVIWGRGALDMKSLGVMELMAFLSLHRRKVALDRDVIFCATPDEEAGGDVGVEWLFKHHPEAIRCSEVLNEGSAGLLTAGGKAVMGIQTAERGVLWVRVTATGEPGHGSRYRPDAASRKLIRALARLEATAPHLELIPETKLMLETLATTETGVKSWALKGLAQPWLLPLIGPKAIASEPALASLLTSTYNTTVLSAGSKVNVVPGTASAEIDIRVLPGHTADELLAWLKGVLADDGLSYEVLQARNPNTSKGGGDLYRALEAAVAVEYPGVPVLPVLTPGGGTDSSTFREHGVTAYGLLPSILTQAQVESMHGDNEFITVEQLTRGTRVVVDAVERASTSR